MTIFGVKASTVKLGASGHCHMYHPQNISSAGHRGHICALIRVGL